MQETGKIWNELNIRYRNSAIIVLFEILLALALTLVSWLFVKSQGIEVPDETTVVQALWGILVADAIVVIILRRFRFSPKSLKSIAVTQGISNLLSNLQTSTILLGSLGSAISVIGFVISLITHDPLDMVRAAIVSIIVLLMVFPRKSTWNNLVNSLSKSGVK